MITVKELKQENKELKLELTKISIELRVLKEKNKRSKGCIKCLDGLFKTKNSNRCDHCINALLLLVMK